VGGARAALKIVGVDFTSTPRRAKPIVVAHGRLRGSRLCLDALEALADLEAFERFLLRPGPSVGGFDFPFGLPRELLNDLGWPTDWKRLTAFCAALSRRELQTLGVPGFQLGFVQPGEGRAAGAGPGRPLQGPECILMGFRVDQKNLVHVHAQSLERRGIGNEGRIDPGNPALLPA